ncbi:hypothetical protein diail_1408 [Diaporthe ilicicola]|nr:hypothetical protein diail_1408 [Diaporthe ilicicola]
MAILTAEGLRLAFLSAVSTMLHTAHSQSSCNTVPISLRVGNVTLANNQVARGVDLGIGTPSQSMAFLPQWPLNNSFVYGTSGYCDAVMSGWADDGCTTFRGSAYNPTTSSTEKGGDDSEFASDSAGTYPDTTRVTDTVVVTSNLTLEDFPLGVVLTDWGEQGYHPQAALGLGSNSTVLSVLLASNAIASRTWSWFWGLNGPSPSTQLDGNLVLGGYDKAKVRGTGYSQALSTATDRCASGMLVTLADIRLNFVNGTTASIFPSDASAALAACLDPAYPTLMTVPLYPYWTNFETLTNSSATGRSTGLNFFDMRYDVGQTPFDGDITIQLSSGLAVRVPNSQYIGPDVAIDRTTGALIANQTAPSIAINALQSGNSDDMITIGRNFFSAAYIMTSYDTKSFTMWEANPTSNQNLVAVDESGNEISSCAGGNATATVTAGGGATQTGSRSSTSGSGSTNGNTRVGAIVGGTIGGVAVVAALIGVAAFLAIRRKPAHAGTRQAELCGDGFTRRDEHTADSQRHALHPAAPDHAVPVESNKPQILYEMLHDSQDLQMYELPESRSERHELPTGREW